MKKKTKKKIMTLAVIASIAAAGFLLSHSGKSLFPFFKGVPQKTASKNAYAMARPAAPIPKPKAPAAPASQTVKPIPPMPVHQYKKGPALVFVIDDLGNSNKNAGLFMRLGSDVNYAVLPLLKHTSFFNNLSAKTGAGIILHQPLESVKHTIPGPGLITSRMPEADIVRILRHNLEGVSKAAGINNHMGSQGTADPRVMSIILRELKQRGFFFLDSRTTSKSVAPRLASQIGVPHLGRDIFLDNEDSKPAIRRQIREMEKIARQRGYVIGIGHDRANTLEVLIEEIPNLRKRGFQIISLRQVLEMKSQG